MIAQWRPRRLIVSGEERILAGYRHGSDGALNCVGIELQPAIFEKT